MMDIDHLNELRLETETFQANLLQLKLEVKNILFGLRSVMAKLKKTNSGLDPPIKRFYVEFHLLQPHMQELLSDMADLELDFIQLLEGGKNTSFGPSSCDTMPSDGQGDAQNICPDAKDNFIEETIPDIKLEPFDTEVSTQTDLIDSQVPSDVTSEMRLASITPLNSVAESEIHHAKQLGKMSRLIDDQVNQQNREKTLNVKDPYTCSVCGKSFKRKLSVVSCKHKESLPKKFVEKSYSCKVCGVLFSKFMEFRAHRASHFVNTKKPFKCKVCDKRYRTATDLQRHLIIHEGKSFSCETCSKSFKTPYQLHLHKKRHLIQRLSCSLCTKTFIRAQALEEHMNVHLGEKNIECDICHEKFPTTSSRDNHKARIHNETCLYNKCPVCGMIFKSNYARDTHCLSHAEEELKKYNIVIEMVECKECGKSMVKSKLSAHMGIHRLKLKAPVVCETCGKTFKDMYAFRQHRFPNTKRECRKSESNSCKARRPPCENGEKPHVCDVCGKSFPLKSSVIQHKKIHTDEKPYACEFCGNRFRYRQGLNFHLVTHTKDKAFTCEFCSKSFTLRTNLQRHVNNVHKGIKKFICDVCGKSFAQKNGLKVHNLTHTGEKPFQCNICGQRFSDPSTAYKHKGKHKNGAI